MGEARHPRNFRTSASFSDAAQLRAVLLRGLPVDEARVDLALQHVGHHLRHARDAEELGRHGLLHRFGALRHPFGAGAAVDGGLGIWVRNALDAVLGEIFGIGDRHALAPDEHEGRNPERLHRRELDRGLALQERRAVGDDDVHAASRLHLREHLTDVAAEALFNRGGRFVLADFHELFDHRHVASAGRDRYGGRGAEGKGDERKGGERTLGHENLSKRKRME